MPKNGQTSERRAEYCREYYSDAANKQKRRARGMVAKRLQSGKIVRRPCEKCGRSNPQAHHEDYSKPLEVRWLCTDCHGALHRKTHCARGHEMTPENIMLRSNYGRRCKTCHTIGVIESANRRGMRAE